MVLEVLVGLPASGKSTYTSNKCSNQNPKEPFWVSISKDHIREVLKSNETPFTEKDVIRIEDEFIVSNLQVGLNVIVDDTNLNPFHTEKRFPKLLKDAGFNHTIIINKDFLKVPLNECIMRDSLRLPEKRVGESVIQKMWKDFGVKWIQEDTYWLSPPVNPNRKEAFIFDIDGTLSFSNGRSWFDESLCETDKPNTPVITIAKMIAFSNQYMDRVLNIIFVSGRKDSCKEQTQNWIKTHIGLYPGSYNIFMRKADDTRGDDIVKKEIYENHIKEHFNILGIFDDRRKVVQMWKSLGLFVFDCNQPGIEF